MCVICRDLNSNEWSIEHMEQVVKALKQEERMAKAKQLKRVLDMVSGIPDTIREEETAHIKQAQYLLSRYM